MEKKINQYNLKGELLNTFENRRDASNKLNIHFDSISACCKGKYKTAGGFIFRYEGDKFKLNNNSKLNDKSTIKCKICGSNETIRSFAMHLKWTHPNYDTQKYVDEFGEFRPKHINQNQIKSTSHLKCEICGESMMHNRQLMYHITKKHKDITKEQYIVKYMYNDHPPSCKCGCGNSTTLLPNGKNCDLNKEGYFRDYIKGHWDWPVFSNINNQSQEELELIEFIKSFYNKEINLGVRDLIPPKEIDIYLPEDKIAIEYNGLYWHSEANNIGKHYHISKTLACKTKGIRLIQIFSDEWNNKKDIVKSKLKTILGENNNKTYYARKCNIEVLTDNNVKKEFLNKYHIQGNDRSKIKLGLYYGKELVAIMTFNNPRISLGGNPSQKSNWELSRYCSSTRVIGGAGKLLKYFIKNYKPNIIYSYSDVRWTDINKNLYKSLGFKYIHTSQPGYYYTKNFTERLHRFNFRKNKLKERGFIIKEGQTEQEILKNHKYYRIWDCGVDRWEFTNLDV